MAGEASGFVKHINSDAIQREKERRTSLHPPNDPVILKIGIAESRRLCGDDDLEVVFRVAELCVFDVGWFCPEDLVVFGKDV